MASQVKDGRMPGGFTRLVMIVAGLIAVVELVLGIMSVAS